jgi:hypothetical protein
MAASFPLTVTKPRKATFIMAKADFNPVTDANKLLFLDNLVTAVGTVGTMVGLLHADITAITTARTNLRSAVNDKIAKKTAAQGATAAWKSGADALVGSMARRPCRTTDGGVGTTFRRIKTHPAYTESIGEQLGVEAPATASSTHVVAGAGPRPILTEDGVLNGEVTIGFLKKGFTGVEIRTRRGTETEYSFLARDTESPYVDTRANLAAGGGGTGDAVLRGPIPPER